MRTFSMQIWGEVILLKTASNNPQLKLTINRFIKALKNLELLEGNIIKIKCDKFMNIEEIKDQTKKAIKEFKTKNKEELNNRSSCLKAASKYFQDHEENETKFKIKHIKMIKEFKKN